MTTIFEHIQQLKRSDWDYYFKIDDSNNIENPFLDDSISHEEFIRRYFERGQKVKVLDSINSDFSNLRYPNHINSVFFLGLIIYYNTNFSEQFHLTTNDPGYKTFPFIWFLISLYHDNAYHIEKDPELLKSNNTIDKLYSNYGVTHRLLDEYLEGTSRVLFDSCKNYYRYRVKNSKVIDHGLFGGIVLFDRLVKIRRENRQYNEETLFWGEGLEKQYKLAGFAIAMHNIWMPVQSQLDLYRKYNLDNLIKFKPIKLKDFNFLYLLGIVDTIDPIKAYASSGLSEKEIFANIRIRFNQNSLVMSIKPNSVLDFTILIKKAQSFYGWLDVEVTVKYGTLKITFK